MEYYLPFVLCISKRKASQRNMHMLTNPAFSLCQRHLRGGPLFSAACIGPPPPRTPPRGLNPPRPPKPPENTRLARTRILNRRGGGRLPFLGCQDGVPARWPLPECSARQAAAIGTPPPTGSAAATPAPQIDRAKTAPPRPSNTSNRFLSLCYNIGCVVAGWGGLRVAPRFPF